MTTDSYGFQSEWIKPDAQAEIYRRFKGCVRLETDEGDYVLSHFAADDSYRARFMNAITQLVAPQQHILSIAEGRGDLLQALKERGYTSLRGVDICPDLVAEAKKACLPVQVADACHLPFEAELFDAVIINESIGALGLGKPLQEAFRVLKTGGRVHVTTYDYVDTDGEVMDGQAIKYRYITAGLVRQALIFTGFNQIQQSSVDIVEIPQELIRDGHVGDRMDIVTAMKTARQPNSTR